MTTAGCFRVAFCPLCKLNSPDAWSLNEPGALIKLLACGGSSWLKKPAEIPRVSNSFDASLLRSSSGLLCWWFSISSLRPPSFGISIVLELQTIGRLSASTWPIFPSQRLGHSFMSVCQLCHICCGPAILSQGCEPYNFFYGPCTSSFLSQIMHDWNTNWAKYRRRDAEGNSASSLTLIVNLMCKLRHNLSSEQGG